MKAAVIYAPGDVRVVDVKVPELGGADLLVRVHACGVCGTEHTLFTGGYYANYPVILGHEFAGEVVDAGKEVRDFKIGDRVTIDPNIVCRRCEYCRMGSEHLCVNLRTLGIHENGGDATFSLIPQTNAYKLADTTTYEQGAFCEPLACVVRGFDMADVQLADTVLVLGAGPIGNLVLQVARLAGAADVIVSEPVQTRRDLALENGATVVFDPRSTNVDTEVRKRRKIGADVVFECTGRPDVQASAVSMLRKGGTLVLFGVSPKDERIQINPFELNENEHKIVGSFNNPHTQARALRLLDSRLVRVDNLVSHRLGLDEYPTAFNLFGSEGSMKIMTVMGAEG